MTQWLFHCLVLFVGILSMLCLCIISSGSQGGFNIANITHSDVVAAGRDYIVNHVNVTNIHLSLSMPTWHPSALLIVCFVMMAVYMIFHYYDPAQCAISKVVALNNEKFKDDLSVQGIMVAEKDIPEIHPTYISFLEFYRGGDTKDKDKYKPSKSPLRAEDTFHDTVAFEDLLKLQDRFRFIALLGRPGSGKTVSSKRLAKRVGQTWPKRVYFHLSFMNMNYKEKLTLRELLLDKSYPKLSNDVCEKAFQWMIKNEERCVFIFDGFDQTNWSLTENPPAESYNTPLPVQDLVANLCNKHFFPNSFLIFTSRAHAMLSIPVHQRPNAIYRLGGFSSEDMKTLFFVYTGDRAEEFWRKLHDDTPQLVSLCYNPLMLQLITFALLESSSEVRSSIMTTTRVFAIVMENLRRTPNMRNKTEDIKELSAKLGKLAYRAMKRNKVIFTSKDLKKEKLDIKTVQDFVIKLQSYKGCANAHVFDGDTKLLFSHQTYQEYFAAYYVMKELPLEDFRQLVDKSLFTDYWSVVRQFLFGLIMDYEKNEDSFKAKREILSESLINHLKPFSSHLSNPDDGRRLGSYLSDIFESRDLSLATDAAQYFPTNANFGLVPLDEHKLVAIVDVLRHTTKYIEWINMSNCQLKASSFRHFCNALTEMKSDLGMLNIVGNHLESVDDVIRILPKIRVELIMWTCFTDGHGGRRSANEHEMEQIQAKLNEINSKLNVIVSWGKDHDFVILRSKSQDLSIQPLAT